MNLENFLEDIKPIAKLDEATEQDTEKLIKNLDSLRLNMAIKNKDRISAHMKQLAQSVRGTVKAVILKGAVSAFKNSRTEAVDLRKKLDSQIDDYVKKTVDLLTKAEDETEAERKIDRNDAKFRNIFDKFTDMIVGSYKEVNVEIVKRNTVGINANKLESKEEQAYAELADNIIEYYVSELLKLRAVLSTFQTFLARVRKKTGEEYDSVLMRKFPPMFKSYLKGKFGLEVGKYLVAHVDKWYSSTNDRKEEFAKFENMINDLLGVR